MKKLKELNVEIIGGQIVQRVIADAARGEQVLDPKRKTIVAKTISEGLINDDRKITHEGDIVVKLSSPYNAVIIDKEHEGMLVSSFCSIIRNVTEIDKKYLVAYLNSEIAQNKLKNSVFGTTMSILSNGKLADLEIPVPSKEKQEAIGLYFEKVIKHRAILQKIVMLENEMLYALVASAEE